MFDTGLDSNLLPIDIQSHVLVGSPLDYGAIHIYWVEVDILLWKTGTD